MMDTVSGYCVDQKFKRVRVMVFNATFINISVLSWQKNLDTGKQTDCLIMDFSKAFDKVSHSLLTHKLDDYGIRGKTNRWIHIFPSRKKTSGRRRRGEIRLHKRWIRSTTRIRTWTKFIPLLHKWHARRNPLQGQTHCRRHHSVPDNYFRHRCWIPARSG